MLLGKWNMRQSLNMSKFQFSRGILASIPEREFANQKSNCVNNIRTDENRRNMLTDYLKEIGAEESNGDIICGLRRHLVAVLTFSKITRKPSRIDEKCQRITYRKSGSGESNGDVICGLRRHLAAKLIISQITRIPSRIDENSSRTHRKSGSGNRMATSFPVCDAIWRPS
jgi:hypothetical protein